MMMRSYFHQKFLYVLILFICIGVFMAAPLESQFSSFTIAPPNSAVGYGGLFNPYVFWPGLSLNAAASTSPLVPFLPFNLNGFGLGDPLWGLSQINDGLLNPLYGFGSSLGNPLLSLGTSPLSFGTTSILGINAFNPFSVTGLLGLNSGIASVATPIAPARTAKQSGTWTGTWQSTYIAFPILWNTGPMLLNIVEDPLLGVVAGTAVLQGSRYASIPFEVSGVIVNNTITVEGFLGTGYDIVLTCILTSPTTMNGFYTVLGTTIPIMDEGIFSLALSPLVI